MNPELAETTSDFRFRGKSGGSPYLSYGEIKDDFHFRSRTGRQRGEGENRRPNVRRVLFGDFRAAVRRLASVRQAITQPTAAKEPRQ